MIGRTLVDELVFVAYNAHNGYYSHQVLFNVTKNDEKQKTT